MEELTHNVEEVVIDGVMVLGADFLEGWAKRAMSRSGFTNIPVKMTESYLKSVANGIGEAEKEAAGDLDKLNGAEQQYKNWSVTPSKEMSPTFAWEFTSLQSTLTILLQHAASPYHSTNFIVANWEGAARWLATAKAKDTDSEALRPLEEVLEFYRPKIEHFKQLREQLRERTPILLQQLSSLSGEKGISIFSSMGAPPITISATPPQS